MSGGSVAPPCKRKFMEQIEKEYLNMKSILIGRLKQHKFKCTTTDVWSHRGRAFSGFTVHIINEKLERESYALAFRPMHGKHTYDNLGKMVYSIHEEFELKIDEITHTITDGAYYYSKMFKEFGKNSTNQKNSQIECSNDDEDEIEPLDLIEENDDMESEESEQIMSDEVIAKRSAQNVI